MSWLPPLEPPGPASAAQDGRPHFDFASLARADRSEALALDELEDAHGEAGGRAAHEEPASLVVRELSGLVSGWCRMHRPDPASFPSLAMRIIEVAEDEEESFADLVNLVRRDAAVSARLIGIANSAAYHRGVEVGTVHKAAATLGTRAITQIALGVASRSLYDSGLREEMEYYPGRWQALFIDSMTVACAVSELSRRLRVGDSEQLFVAGLFHDIGKALALRGVSALNLSGVVAPFDGALLDLVLEQVHVEVGVEAQLGWRLPSSQVRICRCHHDALVPDCDEAAGIHLLRVVSGLQDLATSPVLQGPRIQQITSSAEAIGLHTAELDDLQIEVAQTAERVLQLFSTRH